MRTKDWRSGSERNGGSNEAELRKGCLFSLVLLWGHRDGCSEKGRESVCFGVLYGALGRAGFLREDFGTGVKVSNLRRLPNRAPVVARSAGPTLHMQEVLTGHTRKSWTQERRKMETNFITGRGREGKT